MISSFLRKDHKNPDAVVIYHVVPRALLLLFHVQINIVKLNIYLHSRPKMLKDINR